MYQIAESTRRVFFGYPPPAQGKLNGNRQFPGCGNKRKRTLDSLAFVRIPEGVLMKRELI